MILVCGEALIDFFPAGPGTSLDFRGKPGGSPFNVAVGIARQNVPASFLSVLSTDMFGQTLRRFLIDENVDLSLAGESDRPTTLAFVQTGPEGVPQYAFIGEQAADRALTEDMLPATLSENIRALSFGSFSLAVEPCGTAYQALMRREQGRRVIALDPNVREHLIADQRAYRQRLDSLLRMASIIKVSTEDLSVLHASESPEDVARRWQAMGPSVIIVTDGSNGAFTLLNGTWTHFSGERVTVADTVGAGDTFQASLLAGLAVTGQLDLEALRTMTQDRLAPIVKRAITAAAMTCTRRGADLPRADELPAL